MKKTHTAMATVGTWKNPVTGKEMKRQLEIGAIFESNRGHLVLKLDAVPVSAQWSGWVSLKPCFPELPPGRKVSPGMPGMPAAPDEEQDAEADEDRPF